MIRLLALLRQVPREGAFFRVLAEEIAADQPAAGKRAAEMTVNEKAAFLFGGAMG